MRKLLNRDGPNRDRRTCSKQKDRQLRRPLRNLIRCFDQAAVAAAFRFLRQASRPNAPRPGMACTRFRRHQVWCDNGTGGGSWSVGSLRGSSSLKLCA